MSHFAKMPPLPYYAVIFANQAANTPDGYAEMAAQMVTLAETMPGYLGIESTRNENGFAITVSYWQDEASIKTWHQHSEHQIAQKIGRDRWYDHFVLRVAKVERHYDGP